MGERTLGELISLSGKVAWVTGAAQGFGRACAERLAEAGASVLLTDRDSRVGEAADELRGKGLTVAGATADVTDPKAADEMVALAARTFGGLDILVNNAGLRSNFLLEHMTEERFSALINVGLMGTFFSTRAGARIMKEQGAGAIINITSIDSVRPSAVGLSHHGATKHALWGFTKAMALELGPCGIRVNAIAPGPSLTEGASEYVREGAPDGIDLEAHWASYQARIPLRRLLKPDEIACATVFLASDLASFVNGAQLIVDGGLVLA